MKTRKYSLTKYIIPQNAKKVNFRVKKIVFSIYFFFKVMYNRDNVNNGRSFYDG